MPRVTSNDSPVTDSGRPFLKFVALALFLGAAVVGYLKLGDALTLTELAGREDALRAYQSAHPALVIGVAFAVYVTVTGLSIPGALVLTLVLGWFFEFWQGLLLVSFASTAGAIIAFLTSRFVLRDTIQKRFANQLEGFNEALQREGAFYLFTLRLIPGVPFFAINLVMGVTPVPLRTFWWVSQLGMLPGTAVYVYAGSQFPSLSRLAEHGMGGILTPQLIGAFVLLGLFPLLVKKGMTRFQRVPSRPQTGSNP
jgi:uncharacterized membrane protein YdjX (TVP38/TMEM64 family)